MVAGFTARPDGFDLTPGTTLEGADGSVILDDRTGGLILGHGPDLQVPKAGDQRPHFPCVELAAVAPWNGLPVRACGRMTEKGAYGLFDLGAYGVLEAAGRWAE